MRKTFRFQLYPSKSQQKLLERTLETCRRWYNQCLAERRDAYQQRGERITKFRQLAQVKDIKRTNPHAAPVQSHLVLIIRIEGIWEWVSHRRTTTETLWQR